MYEQASASAREHHKGVTRAQAIETRDRAVESIRQEHEARLKTGGAAEPRQLPDIGTLSEMAKRSRRWPGAVAGEGGTYLES